MPSRKVLYARAVKTKTLPARPKKFKVKEEQPETPLLNRIVLDEERSPKKAT